LLRDINDTESKPTAKGYERQCSFLDQRGQNGGCGAEFVYVPKVLEDSRINISRQIIDIVWNGDGSDENQSIVESRGPSLSVQ
jgi:hypothetical protein